MIKNMVVEEKNDVNGRNLSNDGGMYGLGC